MIPPLLLQGEDRTWMSLRDMPNVIGNPWFVFQDSRGPWNIPWPETFSTCHFTQGEAGGSQHQPGSEECGVLEVWLHHRYAELPLCYTTLSGLPFTNHGCQRQLTLPICHAVCWALCLCYARKSLKQHRGIQVLLPTDSKAESQRG